MAHPLPRFQANTGLQAPEPTWFDHLLTGEEQQRIARLLRAAGFDVLTTCASISGMVRSITRDPRRQRIIMEIMEAHLEQ